jgi:hypothetical protein
MPELPDPWTVDLATRLKDLPAIQTGIKLPTPIIARAEQLLDALDDAGEHRPDRQFLIAALVFTTEPDAEDLAARLRAYRLARVHQALIGEAKTSGEAKLPKQPRG